MRKRKGIYQALDAAGNVISDERWQMALPDAPGASNAIWQIEAEVTRIPPFPYPRIESLAAQLVGARPGPDGSLECGPIAWQTFSIHTRDGAMEAGVGFEIDQAGQGCARFCWRRHKQHWQRQYVWRTDCEIGYNSALFRTAAVWRGRLRPGESQLITMIDTDAVTFEPQVTQQIWSHRGFETLDTPFGRLSLAHYEFSLVGTVMRGRLWCDQDGVVYDYAAADGSRFRLAAINAQ